MLSDAPVKGVYVTQFARSQQTGQPTALAVGVPLTTYSDPTALAAAVTAAHANDTVLVVGHTNTVDEIAAAFGAPGVGELNETTFDRMFIIGRNLAGTTLIRVRYGAASL